MTEKDKEIKFIQIILWSKDASNILIWINSQNNS